MKTALAVWNNRIAPVFDAARRVIIVESETVPGSQRDTVLLTGDQPLRKVRELTGSQVHLSGCGHGGLTSCAHSLV